MSEGESTFDYRLRRGESCKVLNFDWWRADYEIIKGDTNNFVAWTNTFPRRIKLVHLDVQALMFSDDPWCSNAVVASIWKANDPGGYERGPGFPEQTFDWDQSNTVESEINLGGTTQPDKCLWVKHLKEGSNSSCIRNLVTIQDYYDPGDGLTLAIKHLQTGSLNEMPPYDEPNDYDEHLGTQFCANYTDDPTPALKKLEEYGGYRINWIWRLVFNFD